MFILEISFTKIVKNKFFQTISVHKSIQLRLRSDFYKNTCERAIVRKAASTVTLAVNYTSQVTFIDFNCSFPYTFAPEHLFSGTFLDNFHEKFKTVFLTYYKYPNLVRT